MNLEPKTKWVFFCSWEKGKGRKSGIEESESGRRSREKGELTELPPCFVKERIEYRLTKNPRRGGEGSEP